jgi:hypothetical protein
MVASTKEGGSDRQDETKCFLAAIHARLKLLMPVKRAFADEPEMN